MHLKIAVCDDEIQIQFLLENLLTQILEQKNIKADIDCYSNGEELCRIYQNGLFDLIFLDIEYHGMSGIEIGKFIREGKNDDTVEIAYISGNTGYAMDLFEYQPINFLVKPLTTKAIQHVIEKYLLRNRLQEEKFQYKIGSDLYQIGTSEILYFSSNARKVTIHQKNSCAEFYASLEQVYSSLKGMRFLYVHKSYLVNYRHIRKMEYEQVTLSDGTIIPISQSRRSDMRKQFLDLKKGEL